GRPGQQQQQQLTFIQRPSRGALARRSPTPRGGKARPKARSNRRVLGEGFLEGDEPSFLLHTKPRDGESFKTQTLVRLIESLSLSLSLCSLENMYKELKSDIEGFEHPGHGDLTGWAKQGVLLLNAVLTVRAHQANSHKERGWEALTDAVVSCLNRTQHGLVFMLWGAHAQKKGSSIDRKRHHVLQTAHPSPLSAHRGFLGCRHFSQTNEILVKAGKTPIDWKAL
uniref:Uracil DNA glycosylase n=1 Tax=Callorhinchus milii TaxID=7868 RepID=A0A4W3J7X2_CALMI